MAKIGPAGQTMAQLQNDEREAWKKYQKTPNGRTKREYETASRILRAAKIRSRRA